MEIEIRQPKYDLDAALRYKNHRLTGTPMSKAEEAYCREAYRKYRGEAHAQYTEGGNPPCGTTSPSPDEPVTF